MSWHCSLDGGCRMTRMSLFNHPLLLGFDQFERTLDRLAKSSAEGYPPYNIEQVGENRLRITLAVAGFAIDELSVELEDNQLVIRGKKAEEPERVYLHRGIATRQFQRGFVLADGIEVAGARLDNGLLHIDLVRPTLESRTRKIAIKSAEEPAAKPPGKARTIDVEGRARATSAGRQE
jgi:HSP20 family molecular chaperone IbpA